MWGRSCGEKSGNFREISHKDVEPYPSILGVCPMVELTRLGSLYLSERGGVPRMCVGAVSRSLVR